MLEFQSFMANFFATLNTATRLIATQRYAAVVNGTGNTIVYTFGECMKDLSQTDCNLCFAQCKRQLQLCYPFAKAIRSGRLFLDGCYIRSDDYNFFNETLDVQDKTVCGTQDFLGNPTVFGAIVRKLVRNLGVEAPKKDNFFVGSVNKGKITVYGLAQCWESVNETACERCLANAASNISSCTPKEEGRVLNAGCYMRVEVPINKPLRRGGWLTSLEGEKDRGPTRSTTLADLTMTGGIRLDDKLEEMSIKERPLENVVSQMVNLSQQDQMDLGEAELAPIGVVTGEDQKVGHHLVVTLATTSAALALVLVVATVVFVVRKNVLKKRRERKQGDHNMLAKLHKSKLNFSYEILEKATNHFQNSNKLGQGGFGSVYKGILPNGKVVAVKRLYFNHKQWVDHFFNEVNLISGIHHKNLVKLLGCSITGPESLLVYEYVPNQSLHDYFSIVKKNLQLLSWDMRFKIILGTAEGLAYLHEKLIIHRDIKLSNVLLDEDFEPKIADFGLARLFPEDKTHVSTAVAGTLGYMAPEYVVRGKLTEKADVYSFGILVLEVVWNLYVTGRLYEAVDPELEANFLEVDASRLLQIGLLCAQASAELRPSMPVIVKMLTDNHDIPQPTHPPFLISNIGQGNQLVPHGANNFQHESGTPASGMVSTGLLNS
uniref:Protein kinase domain-containing protein n=1 Tax=Fagus sylvatica TaxID=28930 RepID=A0A2N9EYW8_FAGSY